MNRTEDRWSAVRTYQQLRPKSVPLSDELQQEADRLINERGTLQSKDKSNYSQDDEDRIEEINERLAAIEATTRIFTPKQKSISGIMIGISFNGKLSADYGLTQERVSIDSDEAGGAPVKPDEPVNPHKVSGSLQEELSAQRTVAIRAELMARPDIALVAVTHRLAGHFCYPSFESVPTAVMVSPARVGSEIDLPVTVGSKAHDQLNAAGQTWGRRLPEKVDHLWDWLIDEPQDVILDLLAFVVAQTINAVQLADQPTDEVHLRGANALSKALGLDMANWWSPTVENYFSRIKRDQILEAIVEATGKPVPERLTALKKKDLAADAASMLTGTRWVPPTIRG